MTGLLKRSAGAADPPRMDSILAMIVSALVGWLVESPVRGVLGSGSSMAVSFVVSTLAFFVAKQYFGRLRGD